tara:strand:- start:388 stop:783 length:396 start_codon:yes stop_codon:yes gene_type:complete
MTERKMSSAQIPIEVDFWRSIEVRMLTQAQRGVLMDAIVLVWNAPVAGYFCAEVRKRTVWMDKDHAMTALECADADWRAICNAGHFYCDDGGHWNIPEIVPWAQKAQRIRADRSRAGSKGAAKRWGLEVPE